MNNFAQRKRNELAQLLNSVFVFYEVKKKLLITISLVLLGVLSAALFLWGTAPHGIGIRTDSVVYFWSAKNLAKGIGLGTQDAFGKFKPLNHFPPLYPILLAAFEVFKIDSIVGARWLGALFVILLVFLFGLLISRLTNGSLWFPTIGILVLISMPAFWETNLYAMTEPLYLTYSLAGFICLDNYSTTSKRRWLLIAAVLFSASFLTRYIGISVIVVGLLFLLFQKKSEVRHKLLDSFILGSISGIPMLIWLVRNRLLTGSETNRVIYFVPITTQEWKSTYESLMTWVEPIRASIKINLIYLIILLISLLMSYLILRRREGLTEQTQTKLPWLLALYSVIYMLFVIIARLWADPTIPLYEDRILYPFLISCFILVLYCLHLILGFIRKRSTHLAVIMTSILVIFAWSFIRSNSSTTFPYIRPVLRSHIDGLGLQFRTYLAKDFQQVVAQLPKEDLLFTDNVESLYFFTQRPSSYIGDLTVKDIEVLQEQLSKREVVVVFMMGSTESQQSLQRRISQFQLIFSDENGRSIYLGRPFP